MNTTKTNTTSQSPIGVFDSGLGGLSILKELIALLPNERFIYLADSKNAPYGEKSKQEIVDFSIKNTEFLINAGCKLVVVACNTATTNAIKILRTNYNIPFIGIEPAIKPAALQSKTHKIGVLATKGTLSSELFLTTVEQFRNTKDIIEVEGTGLVKLIEEGKLNETKTLLEKYLDPMLKAGVDNIVLGCSHYPFLVPIIKQIVPKHVNIIDSGDAVARQTKNILEQNNLLATQPKTTENYFYTNSSLLLLTQFLKQIEITNGEVLFEEF